jgi:hypothetical protein
MVAHVCNPSILEDGEFKAQLNYIGRLSQKKKRVNIIKFMLYMFYHTNCDTSVTEFFRRRKIYVSIPTASLTS